MKKIYASDKPDLAPWEAKHSAISREISARGMVLLENKGGLPLSTGSRIALFGYGARNTAYCGYGAASVNSREYVSIEKGLLDAGFVIGTQNYLDRYERAIKEEEEAYFQQIRDEGGSIFERFVRMYGRQFTPVCQLPITMKDVRTSDTDTAVFVITRVSGESADRKAEPGDYELSEGEKDNLTFLSEHYKKLIVVLNAVGVIDTRFLRKLPHLDALLFAGLNGGETGSAVADVLSGRVTPEGKLVATWAERYADYPNADTFGLMDGNTDDELYSEGIYVGYRYFDSFGITPAYPFGYGLSYTDFSWNVDHVCLSHDLLEIAVSVRNTGKTWAGREVLQAYVSCPEGRLSQPAQKLGGFQKTGLMKPGKAEQVTITIHLNNLASYDEEQSAWVLEQGDYIIRVGNSSRSTVPAAILRVEKDTVIQFCRPFTAKCDLTEEFHPKKEQSIFFGETLPENLPVLTWTGYTEAQTQDYQKRVRETATLENAEFLARHEGKKYTFRDYLENKCTAEELAASMSCDELAMLVVGNVPEAKPGESRESFIVASAEDAPADIEGEIPMDVSYGASYTTAALIASRLLPNMNMGDGGCGIRTLPEFELDENGKLLTMGIGAIKNGDRILHESERRAFQNHPVGKHYWAYTTALPMELIQAQTWDPECWRRIGEIERIEMEYYGIKLWLAPGMNIHRNPLCGRNFEYLGEDPLLTGLCAAEITLGVQEKSTAGVTIKHMACNNQEENRGGMNAHVSERALREIYLKGFEIAIRTAHPTAIMTGHNLVNGVNAAESFDLLTSAAREEWGFDGLVMTDWNTTSKKKGTRKYGPSDCVTCLQAGTDLIMPGTPEDIEVIREGIKDGSLKQSNLRWCAVNILRVMGKLYARK